MANKNKIKTAAAAAFPHTIPILAGFLFLGTAYGIYMNTSGFSPLYPIIMSITVFGGSIQFVAVGIMIGMFDPLGALALALMVNARHLFYGISMLEKYRGIGKKSLYMIFGMCDETFSINCTTNAPEGVDRGWFMFFVTLFDHLYWICGTAIGSLLGTLITFSVKGLDFVMTALFIVIFLELWFKEKSHHSSLIGLGLSIVSLILLGGANFIVPAMLMILGALTLLRKPLERAEE